MNEIAGALISITLVMMLVFIPVSFMPGTSGVFYRQFGLTMAIAIFFSAVNALTLSPALCAVFLKPHGDKTTLKERMATAYSEAGATLKARYKKAVGFHIPPVVTLLLLIATITFMVLGWFSFENVLLSSAAVVVALLALIGIFRPEFHEAFEKIYNALLGSYKGFTKFFIKAKALSLVFVAAAIAILVWLMSITPTAMVPNEDTGTIFAVVDMPPATSQERTGATLQKLDSIIGQIPAVQARTMIDGYSFVAGQGATYGTFIKIGRNDQRRRVPTI